MEKFYKGIRARSDEKPRLMTAIIAVFYFCMGMGFTGIRFNGNFTMVISCLLCLYMASLVYAVVKGNIAKAVINCVLFFVLGVLFKFMAVMSLLNVTDILFAAVLFVIFFGIGMILGKVWYGKYID